MIDMDYIFSYWIFIWFIFYLAGLIEYNPKFAILLGIIENIAIMLLMIYMNTNRKLLLLFFIMFIILKIIPIIMLRNTKIKKKDVVFTFVLFFIYLFWMTINGKTFNDFYIHTVEIILHNKNTLPGMSLLDKVI